MVRGDGTVRVDERSDVAPGVVVITIDRPDRRNAVDHPTLEQLRSAQLAHRDARVLVLTGASPAFCAGADLHGVEEGAFTALLGEVLRGFGEHPGVVLAAIDGAALGAGTQLAVASDLRIATPASRFGIPAARLGLAVDRWTIDRLTHEFGGAVARAMLLGAEVYEGSQLAAFGSVHRLGGLDDALAWAAELAALAPLTIRAHKLGLERTGPPASPDPAFDEARARAWSSADAAEGRAAFLSKRPPAFTAT